MPTMSSIEPTAIISLATEAAWISVFGPDGQTCAEPLRSIAEEALREAQDLYGGELYLSDGDTQLDCENVLDVWREAIGIVVRHLVMHGYVVAVVSDLWSEEAQDDASEPSAPSESLVWSCYACKEVLRPSAPYSSGCTECLGQRRYREHGGAPGPCPWCGGRLNVLCDPCETRERRWQDGEDVATPKPPEPQGDA